jgi:hypothetical protein
MGRTYLVPLHKINSSGFVHPCCTSVSRMILKRNRDSSLKINKLGLDRISLRSSSKRKNSKVSPLYTNLQFIDRHRKLCISSIKVFFFQLATGRIESAVYKKLIAPFKHDLPTSDSDGLRRVCADHKYAYFGNNPLKKVHSLTYPCQLVPLPETSYEVPWSFILSKNSSYKDLINWR